MRKGVHKCGGGAFYRLILCTLEGVNEADLLLFLCPAYLLSFDPHYFLLMKLGVRLGSKTLH